MGPKLFSRFGILTALAAGVLSGQISADHMQQVWAIQLGQLIKEPAGWMTVQHETVAVAFSPDDKRLAVTLTHHQRDPAGNVLFNTHVLVVDVQSPQSNVHQFDLSGTCGADLSWNDGGDAILVCGTLVRLQTGVSCIVSPSPRPIVAREYSVNKAYWLDPEHVVRYSGEILDLTCNDAGSWPVEAGWRIVGAAVSKGWVLLAKIPDPVRRSDGQHPNVGCGYSIVDRDSHRELSGWPSREVPCGKSIMLAVGAGALCFDLGGDNITNGKLHCEAVSGWREILVPRQLRAYVLNQAAVSSPRVIADQWKYERFAWLAPPSVTRRAVVDLLSGNEVSSWKPRVQNSTSPHIEDQLYHSAFSAGGELVAESGDDSLELYRISP